MPTPTSPPSPPPAGYTGMDDVLIPVPPVPTTIQSEVYPFSALSRNANGERESGTRVYITSESFKTLLSTSDLAERWITRHADPKSRFKLLSRTAVEPSAATPAVLDEKGKVFSPPYMLTFESQAAQAETGNALADHDDYNDRYRQMFYFLPVSAQHIFTARVVRRVKYFEAYPQFEAQYEHFLATLKRDTITPQSIFKGSKPLTRRFYTAHFSFELLIPESPGGSNQWLINKTSAKRTDLWHTPEGDIAVGFELISGYDFEVERENQRLMLDEKGLVKNLGPVVRSMDPKARVPALKYLQPKWGTFELFGHREEDASTISIELFGAYKTGKQFNIDFSGPPAAMQAHEQAIYAWLAQFKVLP